MDELWSNYGNDDNWGILLVGTRNVFNKLNCIAMLWRRWGQPLQQRGHYTGQSLAMVLYTLCVLPIIEHLEQYCEDDTSRAWILYLLQI
eukprot:11100173-Ditylum_brightwellii.AAC.1